MYGKEILNSWNEVAQYIGRSKRTVQRWERAWGLPVHRVADRPGDRIMGLAKEIDAWVKSTPRARSEASL